MGINIPGIDVPSHISLDFGKIIQERIAALEKTTQDSPFSIKESVDTPSELVEFFQLNAKQSAIKKEEIKLLENALNRWYSGTYGICSHCGDLIPQDRLTAVPHTDQCVKCRKSTSKVKVFSYTH